MLNIFLKIGGLKPPNPPPPRAYVGSNHFIKKFYTNNFIEHKIKLTFKLKLLCNPVGKQENSTCIGCILYCTCTSTIYLSTNMLNVMCIVQYIIPSY